MFYCESCKHKSNRKYNLERHIETKHKRCATVNELLNISNNEIKPTIDNNIISNDNKLIDKDIIMENNNRVCQGCQKNFKTPHGFRNHQKICKGVANKLECHFCHKVFTKQQAKSKHLKICKVKKEKELASPEIKNITTPTIHNNIITNNTTIHIQDFGKDYNSIKEDIENIPYISDDNKKNILLAYNIMNTVMST